jgi:hypothetical protein
LPEIVSNLFSFASRFGGFGLFAPIPVMGWGGNTIQSQVFNCVFEVVLAVSVALLIAVMIFVRGWLSSKPFLRAA